MRISRVVAGAAAVLVLGQIVLSSCQKAKGKKSSSGDPEGATEATTPAARTGAAAKVGPSATDLVTLSPEEGSSAEGSEVTFPPGALTIDTNVRMEDGVTLATSATLAALGAKDDNAVAAASESVAILADDPSIEAASPFSVSLKINEGNAALTSDDDLSNLVVIYQANVGGAPMFGVISRADLNVENGKIVFGTTHFGVYQAAFIETPSSVPTKAVPAGPISTKRESLGSPIEVAQLSPVAFTPGTKVEVKGSNFRQSVEVIVGGIKANGVSVASSKSLSFVVPAGTPAGSVDVTFKQDGVSSSVQGFVTDGQSDVPRISDDPTKRFVTDADRALWTQAASWGDHQQAGYLKELGPARFSSLLLLSNNGIDSNANQTSLAIVAPSNMTDSRIYVLPEPPGVTGQYLSSDMMGNMSWETFPTGANVANGLDFNGTADRTLQVERNTTAATAGSGLTVAAGGTKSGESNQGGGTLTLASGIATGTGDSEIDFKTAKGGIAGTADNLPATRMKILSDGELRLMGISSGYVGFKTQAAAGATTYVWPSVPDVGEYLTTDGLGNLSWDSPASPAFSGISAGVSAVALQIGTGGSMSPTGTGTITANDYSGTLAVANGGTGSSSLAAKGLLMMNGTGTATSSLTPGTAGKVLYDDGTNWTASNLPFTHLASGTNTSATMTVDNGGQILVVNSGVVEASAFKKSDSTSSAVDLDTSEASGTLPVSKGGTGLSTIGSGQLLAGNGTSSVSLVGTGVNGQFLKTSGSAWGPASLTVSDIPAAGLTGEVQFNNSGTIGSTSSFLWDDTRKVLNLVGIASGTTVVGFQAGDTLSGAGANNSFFGNQAGQNMSSGTNNTFLGYQTGYQTSSSNDNTFVGSLAGNTITTGAGNVFIGKNAQGAAATTTGAVAIGVDAVAASGEFVVNTSGVERLHIDSAGSMGIGVSNPVASLDVGGDLNLRGLGGAPGQSSAGNGKLYFDSASNKLFASSNGSQFEEVFTGVRKIKVADQSLASSTTLQPDSDLGFAIGANEIWMVRIVLRLTSTSSTPGFKFALSGPAAPSFVFVNMWRFDEAAMTSGPRSGTSSSAIATAFGTVMIAPMVGSPPTDVPVFIEGTIKNGVTPGSVVLQWAQFAMNASASVVKAGSYMVATRIK